MYEKDVMFKNNEYKLAIWSRNSDLAHKVKKNTAMREFINAGLIHTKYALFYSDGVFSVILDHGGDIDKVSEILDDILGISTTVVSRYILTIKNEDITVLTLKGIA